MVVHQWLWATVGGGRWTVRWTMDGNRESVNRGHRYLISKIIPLPTITYLPTIFFLTKRRVELIADGLMVGTSSEMLSSLLRL
jgi:hypothetical protein